MRLRNPTLRTRRGVVLAEAILLLSMFFFPLIGMIVMGLGIFRYQLIAGLAREGARYASVHGAQYQQDTGNTAATPLDVYNNAILPMASGLNTSLLTYSVTWDDPGKAPTYVPSSPAYPGLSRNNNVTVTVSYRWNPEAYFGPETLSSTSVMPTSY
jgi:hypothetical protein